MRHLLITTGDNDNPGDQFIRIGVESLVREVDPSATFERLNKEDPEDYNRERPFDKAILCGMPLWWNNRVSKCQDIHWWQPIIRGWPSAKKENFLVLGAGSAVGDSMENPREMFDAVGEVIERSFAVTTRQPVFDRPDLISSVCPAAFSLPTFASRHVMGWNFFNAMADGAHDAHFNPTEAAAWREKLPEVAREARGLGFRFVAHSLDEVGVGRNLGWLDDEIHFYDTPQGYLDAYKYAGTYVGNRLHGAMVASCAGATSVAIGYDSRVEMLRPFTPNVFKPSEFQPGWVGEYNRFGISSVHATLARERKRMLDLLRDFIFS